MSRFGDVKAWCRLITTFIHKGQQTEAFTTFRRMKAEGVLLNEIALVATLNSCLFPQQVKEVHLYILEIQCEKNTFVGTALLNAYGKCGEIKVAEDIFGGLIEKDLVSWTAMITAYAQHEFSLEALLLYRRMLCEGIWPNRISFLSLLSSCTKLGDLTSAMFLHTHVSESGNDSETVIRNGIICMYDRCGSLENAHQVFEGMSRRDVISWTSLISAYSRNGQGRVAVTLFRRMCLEGQPPNKVTFLAVLEGCAKALAVEEGEIPHACIKESGLNQDVVVATALVNMYGKSAKTLPRARRIFDKAEGKDSVMWNAMIGAYAQHGHREPVLELYQQMTFNGNFNLVDKPAFVSVLSALTGSSSLSTGKVIHEKIFSRGFESDTIVRNALMNMYGKCSSPEESRRLFETGGCSSSLNLISWNTLIAAYSQNGDFEQAVQMFRRMQLHGVVPDKATLLTMLYACSTSSDLKLSSSSLDQPGLTVPASKTQPSSPFALEVGKLSHSQGLELGFANEITFQTALVVMYGRCGALEEATENFQRIQVKNTASWNAMIAASALNSRWRECFRLLQDMHVEGFVPDEVTFVVALSCLAAAGAAPQGRSLHRFAEENGLMTRLTVANAVVDLYSTCGQLSEARHVMSGMAELDTVTWNALIAGYSRHGQGREAVEVLREMQLGGFLPNRVTLVSLLHACAHAGLVDEGCMQFRAVLNSDYGFGAIEEQWGCVIDLLGRAGHLEEAEMAITTMPFKPNLVSWMSLLGSCKLHGDLDRGKAAAIRVLEFDSQNSAALLMISSMDREG